MHMSFSSEMIGQGMVSLDGLNTYPEQKLSGEG